MAEEVVNHRTSPLGKALSQEEIEKRFFHATAGGPSSIDGVPSAAYKHDYLVRQFTMFSEMLNTVLGAPSREASVAFTHLEEASSWAHKAITALTEEWKKDG